MVPEFLGIHGMEHLTIPLELPLTPKLYLGHQGIRNTDGEVRVVELLEVPLPVDELHNIRVIIVEHQHQGPAPGTSLLDHVTGGD